MKTINLNAQLVSTNRFLMPAVNTVWIQSALGDFNRDGLTDIALSGMDVSPTADQTNDIRILLAKPDGTFFDGTFILGTPIPSYQTSNLLTADLNLDGFTDLVIARSGGDNDTRDGLYSAKQLIYLSDSKGGFTAIQSPMNLYAHHVMLSDINGDSRTDAFFFATGQGPSVFMINDPKNDRLTFSSENLPVQALFAEADKSWDIIERYSNGDFKKVQVWHQHNTAFNDIDRDGDLDMVMFFGSGSQQGLIYKNSGINSGKFDQDPRITFNTVFSGIPSAGNFMYAVRDENDKFIGLRVIQQGASFYETIQFDLNYDGWEDIIALATTNNADYFHPSGADYSQRQYAAGTDGSHRGTLFQALINDGASLRDETDTRINQPNVTRESQYGSGHISMLHSIDLNGDGHLDLIANGNSGVDLGTPNWVGETDTIFMLNNGKGQFEQTYIAGLEYGAFDPIPIEGKLGFVASVPPTEKNWRKEGFPPRPDWVSYFYKTDIPWTTGNDANNYLYGTPADDTVDGLGGIDTYISLGRSEEFTVEFQKQSLKISDLRGLSGRDDLNNIERVRFYDKTIAFDIEGNAGQAYRLYKAALDRTPDDRGLASWINYIDNGGQKNAVSQMFIDSQEFGAKYGALDNYNFVNQLYLNVLDRNGEAAGLNAWVGALSSGALSRAQVLVGFSESDENKANVIGQIENGIPYTEWWLS